MRSWRAWIPRATRRLGRHRLALGFAVAAVAALLAWVAWASVNGVPLQDRYTLRALVPKQAPIVAEGDAVRIAGQLAGTVTEVAPEEGARAVTMELRPQFAPVGRDAAAIVRVKSIVYLTYVEIRPGDPGDPMPEGGTIPLPHAGSNVDLLEVVRVFDRRTREALQTTVRGAGVGIAGRGRELNAALRDLPEIASNGTRQLEALVADRGALAELIVGADRTFAGLGGAREDDVAALIASGEVAFGALARRSDELAAVLELVRPLSDDLLARAPQLDRVLADAAALGPALRPVADRLERALPDLNRVLGLGDELRAQTDRLTRMLRPVLRAAAPVLAELEGTVAMIDPLRRPLARLVETVAPFEPDVARSARALVSATTTRFEQGRTAAGNPALRFVPVFTPHGCREPFPAPGSTLEHSGPPC